MKVKKQTLLLLACLVWTIAGANIIRIEWKRMSDILLYLIVFYPL